jgi:hypothetical protein
MTGSAKKRDIGVWEGTTVLLMLCLLKAMEGFIPEVMGGVESRREKVSFGRGRIIRRGEVLDGWEQIMGGLGEDDECIV